MLGNGSGLNMTNEIDRDNDDWLSALSGEPRLGADKYVNAQAEAIRNALARRAAELDEEAPKASDAGYHRLLFRLKREGYIGPEAEKKLANKLAAANDSPSSHVRTGTYDLPPAMRSANSGTPAARHDTSTIQDKKTWWNPALGMAAVFVIGAALVFYMQVSGHKEEDPFAVRGGAATVLIVPDQNEKVIQLVETLNPLGGNVRITQEADGSISLLVKANDKVLARLAEERILPDVKDGLIKLSIVLKPAK